MLSETIAIAETIIVFETIAPSLKKTINLFFDLPLAIQIAVKMFNSGDHKYQVKMVTDQLNQIVLVHKDAYHRYVREYPWRPNEDYNFSIEALNISVHSKNWHRQYREAVLEIPYMLRCNECSVKLLIADINRRYCSEKCARDGNGYHSDSSYYSNASD